MLCCKQVYYNDLMKLFSSPDCSSALYLPNTTASEPTIFVNNSGLSKRGKPISYLGYAVEKEPPAGELTLYLHGVPGTASYRICAVGEKTFLGKYHQYSIVTDDTGFSLYVMARNVSDFFTTYDSEVRATLDKLGYSGLFAPKKNRQDACPDNIYYPPWP